MEITHTRRPRRSTAAIIAVVTTLMASLLVVMGSTNAANAATVDTNAWYVLVNRNSGKALDVYNLATNDGARITQWTRNNGNQQQWQFVDSGGGYYRHQVPATPARCSTSTTSPPPTAAPSSSGPTATAPTSSGAWPTPTGGYVRLISRNSNKALEVQGASTADGANIVQYDDWGGSNQQWQLVQVGGGQPHHAADPAPAGTCDLPSTYRWTLDGRAGEPEVGVGLAQGLHRRPLQRQAPGLRHHARHGHVRGVR